MLVAAALLAQPIVGMVPGSQASELDAFPQAVGHGRSAQGGRNGRIVFVDNLDDSGPGSLRNCAEASGPRNCVFRVGGHIRLRRSLLVEGPESANLSILGQTAPGGGIVISVHPVDKTNLRTVLAIKDTHDIIVSHIRLRSKMKSSIKNVDALTIENSRKVYIDHVSGSWATDENINIHGFSTDITIAYSIFGEGLKPHSKCALLASDPTGPQNISFWRNLCISNNDRNPDDNHYGGSCIEIVDNVFYNAGSEWSEIYSQYPGGTPIDIIGNYYKGGPSTSKQTSAVKWNSAASVARPSIFIRNNRVWSPEGKTLSLVTPDVQNFLVESPNCPATVPSFSDPAKTYEEVRLFSGALPRDAVDNDFIADLGPIGMRGRGRIRAEAGPIIMNRALDHYLDLDRDGMADRVEAKIGASPGIPDAWLDGDEDGWPNFDDFIAWLSSARMSGRYPD